MGFLTIINYIAMGIGYIIILLVLIFLLWLFVDIIKEKRQRRKWEREKADREKTEKILEEEKQTANPHHVEHAHTHNAEKEAGHENKEKLVDETGKLKVV